MTDLRYDIAIVGAGIVGLATAMEVVQRRPDLRLVVLEKEGRVAAHQAGNNSGVIHAGLYYKPGSLKAEMVVEGARRMIEFCQEHDVPHQVCGKVVVAIDDTQLPALEELHRRGTENGVLGLRRISRAEIKEYEPHGIGVAALLSPNTGIVDYRAVAQTYARLVEAGGGAVRLNSRVTGLLQDGRHMAIETSSGDLRVRGLINCAGLQADQIARLTGSSQGLRIVSFRGEYYELAPEKRKLVRGLIYPVPDPRFPFLGVHFTRKINGAVEAGPNAVLAFAREGYGKTDFSLGYSLGLLAFPGFWVMASRYWKMGLGEMYRSWNKRAFVKALQTLLPELGIDDILPGGAGVRAQGMDRRGNLLDDFCFTEASNAIHVLNAPSPAATASIVIGRAIADKALSTLELDG